MTTEIFSTNFLKKQKERINARILKYNNPERIKEELLNGDLSDYIRYKQSTLVPLLEVALKKIDSHEYGYCEKCNQAIELKRLELVPFAKYCMTCMNPETNNS
ncbi:TraR/DksA C4-type zinc finger protein [Patescibacteria group bacterium]|nr:TraR/DksA C4-type zinc finger protein [Patescibacteria group bacterium]